MQGDCSTVWGCRISKWTEFVLEKYVKADKKTRKFNKNKNYVPNSLLFSENNITQSIENN